jgi:hypothetical protein
VAECDEQRDRREREQDGADHRRAFRQAAKHGDAGIQRAGDMTAGDRKSDDAAKLARRSSSNWYRAFNEKFSSLTR